MKTLHTTKPSQRRSSHSALFLLLSAAVVVTPMAGGIVKADPGGNPGGDPPPVVVDSIEPTEIVQGQVPQPEIQVFGSDFIEGFPNDTNRPTVTLRQQGKGGAEFSALAFVNFAGTVATVSAEMMNLLQAPLGVYDVIVTRPTDGASDTLKGAFTVIDGEPGPGEIALVVQSAWGGPVNDVEVVGNLAYAAIGSRLVVIDVSDASNPVEIGSMRIMPGVTGVAVRDGYVFLGATRPYSFTVADVSDPSNPVLVSAGMGDPFSHDVHLYGNLAYVRASGGQVEVFDVTDPQQLVPMGGVLIGIDVAAMSIVGDRLYVGTGVTCCAAQLKIYDLASDPLNPALLGSIVNGGGKQTTGLDIEDDYLVWTVRREGKPDTSSLQVVDVSDPLTPAIVGSYDNGSVGEHILADVAFSAGYAYVADATTQGTGAPHNWAFAEGLMVFDIATDPTNPTPVATFKTHGDVLGVDVMGNRAYLHDAGEGLIILDVSDPTNPVRLGNYHSPAELRQMEKVGDLLYVADAWNGFTVLNVADASHPEVVSVYLAEHVEAFDSCADMSYPLGVDAYGIDVKNNTVYLGAGHLGLEVIDVTNLAEPTFLGALRIDQLPPPAAVASKFAGVSVWDDVASIGFDAHTCGFSFGIFLNIDISDPTNMYELGRVSHGPKRASTIEFGESGTAFIGRGKNVGAGDPDLTIDTLDPKNPTVMYEGQVPSVADVALDGNVLYLASDHTGGGEPGPGLYIQDVTDPANPVLLTHVDNDFPLADGVQLNHANAVTVQNERTYVAGLGCVPGALCSRITYMFNTSDPTSPILLDHVSHVGGGNAAIHVDGPGVYVTDGGAEKGLVILNVIDLLNPADLDADGFVGASDLLILLANWGPCPPKGDCPADLDGNGSVGAGDLLILLANWG